MSTLASAIIQAAETKRPSTADPNVSAAFALGWHMSELNKLYRRSEKEPAKDLPGLGSLSLPERETILVDQIKTSASKLTGLVAQAGLAGGIDLGKLQSLVTAPDESDPVRFTHVQIIGSLTAADFRLGKAYGLGRALADTCQQPDNAEELRTQLNPFRIANLLRWLDDLASVLPEHAADSVSKSLASWRDAVHPPSTPARPKGLKRVAAWWKGDRRHRKRTPVLEKSDTDEAVRTLGRQGEIWRALLSDEKAGTDMLEINNYLDAVRELASRIGAIARGVMSRMPFLTALVLIFLAGGIALIALGGSSRIVGGATSILVALGLTWRGLGATAGKLIGKLEQPLWGAVLDDAIADAITLLPASEAASLGRRRVAVDASDHPKKQTEQTAASGAASEPTPTTPDPGSSAEDPTTPQGVEGSGEASSESDDASSV